MTTAAARRLRSNETGAEHKLWAQLRDRQLGGYKFRRQQSIGPYVVDFICFSRRLIVEIDGGQHAVDFERDEARTAWLEAQGFRVTRFWNNQVLDELEGVKGAILIELELGATPSP